MNAFQVGGITLAILLVFFTLLGARRGRLSRGSAALWSLLWLAMGVSIAKPDLTIVLARALGIDRGADLVFYFGIVMMFIGFFAVMARLRTIEHNITRIARHIALEGAQEAAAGSPQDLGREAVDP